MRNLLIVIMMLFCIKAKSQLGEGRFCINLKEKLKISKSVKTLVRQEIYGNDTTTYTSHIENGMPVNTLISNNVKYEYKFDESHNLLSLKEIHLNNDQIVKEEICHKCIYDSEKRLIKYIITEKSIKKKNREFTDEIIYSNNGDTIKYIGAFYSMITIDVINGEELTRITTDTLEEMQRIQKFYASKKISSRNFRKGKEGLGTYYLYSEKGLLKSELYEGWDDMDFLSLTQYINYFYDGNDKLIEERSYTGDSQLDYTRFISYNEKGFIEKEVERHNNSKKQRIFLYSYEYW